MISRLKASVLSLIYIQIVYFKGYECLTDCNCSTPAEDGLFSPIKIRNVTLRNRICVTPMSMYNCGDGMATDFHLGHLQSFALGGAGLVMAEATAVTPEGRISPKDLGLWKDEQVEPFRKIIKQIKTYGAVPGIQLAHAGRKASTEVLWAGGESLTQEKGGWDTIAPTALAYGKHIWKVPKEASFGDIGRVIQAFVSSAKRAVRAGFEIIELQFGNGYLVHQFLSPVSNKRKDEYGGSLTNRTRLGIEIARRVRQTIPDSMVLGVRVSVSDYVPNGWDIPQTIEFAKELKNLGIDFMTCTSGLLVPMSQTNGMDKYAVQVPSAGLINRLSGMRTAAVGQIVNPKYADKIITDKTADLVMIGRAFLNNPHWPYHAADVLDAYRSIQYPKHYGYAIGDPEWREMSRINGN